jgi:hypothetical protein
MSGLKRKAKMWRETITAGFFDTGNISATVNGKPVLSWAGTPTQKDTALKMLPVVQQKLMPEVSPEAFADATIASIRDEGMASTDHGRSIQTVALLWRLFTTPVNRDLPGVTYGDLIATTNLHVAYEVQEQPNDEFKVTWKVSTRPSRPLWLPWRVLGYLVATVRGKENRSNPMAARLGNVLFWASILIAGVWLWFAAEIGLLKNPSDGQSLVVSYGGAGIVVLIGWALRYILRG